MMTQKDLAAIKRRLNPDKRSPVMIRGCYLDPKGEILSTFHLPVGMLAQEENEKYMGLFKKTLSGTPGQNLIPVSFSTEQVNGDDAYALLMGLCRTELSDEDMAMSLYDCIIRWLRSEYAGTQQSVEEQQKGNNWLILLLYDSFDVPYTHPDGEDDLEMSENIFNYMLCAICPVQQGKDQLSYDAQDGKFHSFPAPWVAMQPGMGFMFPVYENGGANISSALFYTKDVTRNQDNFAKEVFHAEISMPASEQKETISSILQNSLKEECSMDVVQSVAEKVGEMIAEQKEDKLAEPLHMSARDVRQVLEHSGVSAEKAEAFEQQYTEVFGDKKETPAVNIIPTREFKVKTPSVQIKVSPDHADLVTTKVIDGQKYIMILADGEVEVNGVNIAIQ